MLLYTIMMVLLVASTTSLKQTSERRLTPFSKHNRRISVILENISPLQVRQRPPQMVRLMSNFHTSAGGEAFVVDPLPDKSAVHDHDGTAGRQHNKPVTDTGERQPTPFSKHNCRISVMQNISPLQLRQRPPQMVRF